MKTELIRLTDDEQQLFAHHKKIIKAGMRTVKTVGLSLKVIRDERLYRNDYSTFEEFCKQEFGLGRGAIHYQIEAAEQRKAIVQNLNKPERKLLAEVSDSTVRELGKVPKRSRARVFKEAVKQSGGKAPTAAKIEAVAPRGQFASFTTQEDIDARISNAYGSVSTAERIRPRWPLTTQRVLDAYDAEIKENFRNYGSLKEMAIRVRVVLSEL